MATDVRVLSDLGCDGGGEGGCDEWTLTTVGGAASGTVFDDDDVEGGAAGELATLTTLGFGEGSGDCETPGGVEAMLMAELLLLAAAATERRGR